MSGKMGTGKRVVGACALEEPTGQREGTGGRVGGRG